MQRLSVLVCWPSVGADLAQTGAMALPVAPDPHSGVRRFPFRVAGLAAGVVIALAHDVVITMAILSLFHIEIDLTIVHP
ncbi:hypothetical protein ACNKHS_02185 [Shigella flexneri]